MTIEFKIVEIQKDDQPPRKRACINCGHRHMCDPNYCAYDWHYISYAEVFDGWCRHWCKSHEGCYAEINGPESKKRRRKY